MTTDNLREAVEALRSQMRNRGPAAILCRHIEGHLRRILAEHPATPAEVKPCEHDGLGCRDRTPHDEHTKVGDGRPCCGWPPQCAATPREGGEALEALVQSVADTYCANHGPSYGGCVDCFSQSEAIADAILTSDWLATREREAEQRGAEKALREAADEVETVERIGRTVNADLSDEDRALFAASPISDLWAMPGQPRPRPIVADWLLDRADATRSR